MHALLATLALALCLAASPAASAQVQQPPGKKAKKVWTNDDLDAMRGGSRQGDVRASAGESAGTSAAAEEKPTGKDKPLPREKDPKLYREKLVPLRSQLEQLDAQIKQLRQQLTHPIEGTNALDLSHTSVIMQPEVALKELEQKRQQLQQKIDDLEDEARRNGISPGDIR